MKNPIEHAISIFGTQVALAKAIGVTSEAVRRWRIGIQRVTAERAIDIERVTSRAVTRHALRPDIYGDPP